jgi:hypothetical protein
MCRSHAKPLRPAHRYTTSSGTTIREPRPTPNYSFAAATGAPTCSACVSLCSHVYADAYDVTQESKVVLQVDKITPFCIVLTGYSLVPGHE